MANAKNTKTNETPAIQVEHDNNTQKIVVSVLADQPEGIENVTCILQSGLTVEDNPKPRVRAFDQKGDAMPDRATVKTALKDAVVDLYETDKHHDIEGAVSQFVFPSKGEDEKPLFSETELKEAQGKANAFADSYLQADTDMRSSLYELARIAEPIAAWLNKDGFDSWVASGGEALAKAFNKGKNAKAEFLLLGRLPKDYYDAMPVTLNSPKAIERHFNLDRQVLAEKAHGAAHGALEEGQEIGPVHAKKHILATLEKAVGGEGTASVLAGHMLAYLNELPENLAWFEVVDDTLTCAKGADGKGYAVPIQFRTGAREHELLKAFCKEIEKSQPDVIEAEQERAVANDRAKAVNPLAFEDYAVSKAVYHLAEIVQCHEEAETICERLLALAVEAGNVGWQQAIADAKATMTTDEKAKAETDAVEDADADA